MYRFINGVAYKVKKSSDEWDVTVHRLGNGHQELSISRVTYLEEDGPVILTDRDLEDASRLDEGAEEAKRLANAKRAARRAKTRVRRIIKVMGLDAMLTLTYRENVTDLARCKAHLKEFIRRVRRVLPGFRYVAAFETQKRGAWHVHIAIHKLPRELPWGSAVRVKSYSVIRAIWRSVAGEAGGNIDQSRRKRSSNASASRIATYLSKYMLKAFEDGDDWKNRYSASKADIPVPLKLRFRGAALRDLIDLAYTEIAVGDCTCTAWLSKYQDTFFLSTEGPPA